MNADGAELGARRQPRLERHRRLIMLAQAVLVPAGLAGIAWAAVRHADSIAPTGNTGYLIGALKHFVAGELKHASAQKRGGSSSP